jgi:hypothetical protein
MTAGERLCYRELQPYKYQLRADYAQRIDLTPPATIAHPFVRFAGDGTLTLRTGYAWDGPSGPARDTPDFMRASLVHDALYQLMRLGLLDHVAYRHQADTLLRKLCLEDGMSPWRAGLAYHAVRLFGGRHAMPRTPAVSAVICVPETDN